jgi:phthalate 4,5-cis-dihydrodiol dehydrogenase
MTTRFGICGLGFAGSVLMAPVLKQHPGTTIVAACEPGEAVRKRFGEAFGIPTYATLEEMLAGTKLDAVYIAAPHQYHAELVEQACARGVHVIVEKPLSLNLADAQRVARAVQRSGVKLVVGTSRSHDPVVATMRRIVSSGEVGRVAMVHCMNYTDWLYRPRRPEELDPARGAGIVFNQLPHQIDSVKAITGARILAVRAVTGALDPARPIAGHCSALLTLEGGAVASLVYSGYDHFDSDELQFWIAEGGRKKSPGHGNARRNLRNLKAMSEGELRRSRYGFEGPVAQSMASGNADRRQPHFGVIVATCERADLRPSADGVLVYGDEGVREVAAENPHGLFGQGATVDELLDAIDGRGVALRDAQWGLDTVAVCLAVQRSSVTGKQVEVSEILG